jgi:hypothetical protein
MATVVLRALGSVTEGLPVRTERGYRD